MNKEKAHGKVSRDFSQDARSGKGPASREETQCNKLFVVLLGNYAKDGMKRNMKKKAIYHLGGKGACRWMDDGLAAMSRSTRRTLHGK